MKFFTLAALLIPLAATSIVHPHRRKPTDGPAKVELPELHRSTMTATPSKFSTVFRRPSKPTATLPILALETALESELSALLHMTKPTVTFPSIPLQTAIAAELSTHRHMSKPSMTKTPSWTTFRVMPMPTKTEAPFAWTNGLNFLEPTGAPTPS